jgi:hypothetical protein
VTSDLDAENKQAEYFQGASGRSTARDGTCKAFVLKILTFKPLALKILRITFCESRASRGFPQAGGRGVSTESASVPKMEHIERRSFDTL